MININKMTVSVLEHVKGSKLKGLTDVDPNETFRVLIVKDSDIYPTPPPRKQYSEDVKRIARKAKRLSEEDKKNGVTREESFKELKQTLKNI